MVSNRQPPKGHGSRIKCWWVPLELQSFETRANFPKKDASVSCAKSSAQSERKSPISGISTAKFASALAVIWDYVGDPAILQTKGNLTHRDSLQNENTVRYSHKQRKQKPPSCDIQSCDDGLSFGSASSPELKSNYEELKNMKKQLLFASCNRVIGNSFILRNAQVYDSHLLMDSPENAMLATLGASSNQPRTSESIDKKPDTKDLVEDSSNVTSKSCVTLEKNCSIHVSSSHPSSITSAEEEDASSKRAINLRENYLQTPPPLNSTYSTCPMESTKEAIIVLKNPGPDIHLGYNIDFLSSSECTHGQRQGGTDSYSLVAESLINVPNSKDHNLHKIERYSSNELTLQQQHIERHWFLVQDKLQNVLADNRYALSGALAGALVSLCLHPVDTVKTIIQSSAVGQNSSQVLRRIIAEKGFLGLYSGISSNIASSAPISAIYTFTYESVKGALLPLLPKEYHSFAHCFAGACSSIATSVIFTPSERIKQQMQVGLRYRNCWNALIGCLENGGLPSLYTGWGAVLCRNIPHSIIKFYTYESLKQLLSPQSKPDGTLGTLQTLICGGLAGSTAALFTTPFDVVKTRLQTQAPGTIGRYNGVLHALQEIAREEGFQGLYRGLTPRLAMYVSQGAIFFASYEFLKAVFYLEVSRSPVKAINEGENATNEAENDEPAPSQINELHS